MPEDGIKAMFEPRSVVLVGASGLKRVGMASAFIFESVIHNMLRFYKGKTHIVDLSGKLGIAVKGFAQVPKGLDLAVLVLQPELALKHIGKLVRRGVKAIVAITGDYKPEQREKLARETVGKGVRVLGPNSILGVINTSNGLCTTFERGVMPRQGGIGVISQGGMAAVMLDWAWFNGVGISKFASMGDKIDVNEINLIDHLARDKDTKVVCVYTEGIREGRKFVEVVGEAVKRKPVVVLKVGITRGEPMRASSRIASLVGRDEIFDAALKKAGAIGVRDVEELFDVATALAKQPPMLGRRVAIVSNVGGPAVFAADAVNREGLELAKLSDKVVKAIKDRYPSVDAVNPIGIMEDAKAERYGFVLKQVLGDPNVDGVMVINALKSCLLEPEDVLVVAEVAKGFSDKPVVDVPMGGEDYALVRDAFEGTDIPTYNLPEKAARALAALYRYGEVRRRVGG